METISRSLLTFLFNSLWQVPAIAAVAAIVCRLMRRAPASHRHAVWVAAMGAALLLPIASLWTSGNDSAGLRALVPPAGTEMAAASAPSTQPRADVSPAPSRTISYGPLTAKVLLSAYLCFFLWRLGRLLHSWNRTVEIWNEASATPTPSHVTAVWQRCLAAFELSGVELLGSSSVTSPVTAGAWRKIVILPESLLTETSENLLLTAIGHEMAHIARRDFAWKVLYEIASIPVSFHPAMLMIWRGIEQSREMACDELVTRKLIEPDIYARSIVTIAAAMSGVTRPGYTLGVFDADILEQRLHRLLERPTANLRRARLLLVAALSALGICAIVASGLAISARAQGSGSPEMKLGVEAYNRGDYQGAVEHFQNAVRQEPDNVRPKLFLANALIGGHFKNGADQSRLSAARLQYLDVLARDPRSRQALEGMVSVSTFTKQFSEAQDWIRKLIAEDPKDESAYYTAGFLDWSMAYPVYAEARAQAGMRVETQGMIPDAAVRQRLRGEIGLRVEDGFRMLQIALQLNPKDDNAMAYMNLLYRMQAAIVDSDAESHDAVTQADGWVQKALETKRMTAQTLKAPSAQLDVDGPAPGPGDAQGSVPPPPPPPPVSAELMNRPVSSLPLPGTVKHTENTIVWQVTGWQVTGGDVSANSLIAALKAKGIENVRITIGSDQLVRIFVGPFNDQPTADRMRSALEAAGFQVIRRW